VYLRTLDVQVADSGKHFGVRGAPGGDDYQRCGSTGRPRRMALSSDQGTLVHAMAAKVELLVQPARLGSSIQ